MSLPKNCPECGAEWETLKTWATANREECVYLCGNMIVGGPDGIQKRGRAVCSASSVPAS